ncbi:coiled-coil domain-containing protein 106-like [Astyanax mexicanus]|uniref:coiled-coil domain-containing protein 106-like n=1 Tax=Astyanax mexicanus TaxID=7994 RepID=UPI0020CAF04B|nr:coiled-coil domain-containing protein 106-like [Astyanax mexicanus]
MYRLFTIKTVRWNFVIWVELIKGGTRGATNNAAAAAGRSPVVMELSSISAARPKRGKKTNKSAETNKEGEHGTVTQLAPTAVMSLKKHQILLAEAKKNEEAMSKTIADLKEERDGLLKQLDEYQKKGLKGGTAEDDSSDLCEDQESSEFSESSSSSSSTSMSSSSEEQRKKRKKHKHSHQKKLKRKKNKKGKEEKMQQYRKRAGNPQQTVRRYKKILHQYRRGKNLRDAYRAVGVDRNTVVANAPIAELAIVAPQEYSKVLEGYSRQEKLQVFAKKCEDVLNNDVQLLNNVEMYKKKNKLLPLMKRK